MCLDPASLALGAFSLAESSGQFGRGEGAWVQFPPAAWWAFLSSRMGSTRRRSGELGLGCQHVVWVQTGGSARPHLQDSCLVFPLEPW